MTFEFSGEIFYWKGPAPFFFVAVPDEPSQDIKAVSNMITYGWGVIPATVTIGATTFKTALFPKDGRYLVPLKVDVRKKEGLELGDMVDVILEVRV